jgi:hypothetical protein
MLQSLDYDLSQAATEAFESGLLSATCTIQTPTGGVTSSGAPNNTWSPVAGLTAIACQCAVPSANAVQATEAKALMEIMARQIRHVLLDGFYPALKQLKDAGQVQALITLPGDSTYTYEVLGAEDDSQGQMTRFECQKVSL